MHGLARVAYVGQRFQVSAPTNFGQPPVLNSYVDTRYECFGGTSAPTYGLKKRPKRQLRLDTSSPKRHLKENPEEKQSEIVIQVEYPHLNHVRATKISKVTYVRPNL